MDTVVHSPRPGWLIVLVLAVNAVVSTVQFTLIIPLIPTFPERLDAPVPDTLWILIAPLLCGTVATPVVGRLADMYGKRRMLLACLGVVAAGNVLGLVAGSVWPLVASRALVGVAMAVIPVSIAILRDELRANRLPFGIAIMSATIGISSGLGLPLGGWLNETFGYASIFWVSLVATVLIGVVLPFAVRESAVRVGGRFDVPGALLLTTMLLAFLVALSNGGDWGWLDVRTLALAAVAATAGGLWFFQGRRAADPVVDLRTSLSRPILLTNLASLAFGLAVYGNMLVTISQAQVPTVDGGFGLDTFEAGLVMLPAGVAAVLASPVAGLAVHRFGGKAVLIAGALVTASGYGMRFVLVAELWQIIVGAAIIQLGVAVALAGIPSLITRYAPLGQTASANSVNSLVRSIGASISAAAIAAAFSLVTLGVSGVAHPTPLAFAITFVVSGSGGILAAAIATFIPSDRPGGARHRRDVRR